MASLVPVKTRKHCPGEQAIEPEVNSRLFACSGLVLWSVRGI